MIIKKLSSDHYIQMDDSEIKKVGDWCYDKFLNVVFQTDEYTDLKYANQTDNVKKVTHSTQPIEPIVIDVTPIGTPIENYVYDKVKPISLSEVRELTEQMDVEKKTDEKYHEQAKSFEDDIEPSFNYYIYLKVGFIDGYNQCLEDNKDKKYTEEDMINAHFIGWIDRGEISNIQYPKARNLFIQSIQPKTEWEVEYDENGKLKLK